MPMPRIAAVFVVIAIGAGTVAAQPRSRCIGRTDEEFVIDEAVAADAVRGPRWSFWWGVAFAVTGVALGVTAAAAPESWIGDDTRASIAVTAGKAGIGALARWLLPLRIELPHWCVDPTRRPPGTQRIALAIAARKERNATILTIVGSTLLNGAGLLYLGLERDDWTRGWITFATGVVVTGLQLWTMPRRAWSLERRLDRGEVVSVAPLVPFGESRIGGVAIVGTW
jgi:hypothetical protein